MYKPNKSKATGLDWIFTGLIRECADLICVPVCDIFNQSIRQGKLSEDWSSARVTPLFEQGDRHDVNIYRPISVIPVVVEVLERKIYEPLYMPIYRNTISTMQTSVGFSFYSPNCCSFAWGNWLLSI